MNTDTRLGREIGTVVQKSEQVPVSGSSYDAAAV